ncbi:MAG: hypothetical protein WCS52_12885 [bacterium]
MTTNTRAANRTQRWWTERVLPRAIFLKQRWLRAGNCHITCPGNQDGLGAQLQARLSGMLFAECQGLTYVHSPFTSLHNTPADEPDWPTRCERFFGIGAGELAVADVAHELGEPRRVNNPTQIRMIDDSFWSTPNCHAYADLYPHQYLRLTDRFAARYHAAPKDGCTGYYTPGVVNVALHLRRGQDLAHKLHLMTRSDDSAVLLQTITDALHDTDAPYVIRVFSQGTEEDFPELRRFGVEFHLNEELLSTFHSLVLSDVLVMAKSCLSYSAALLSKGLKIYGPTGHRPLPGWLVLGKDGRLDQRHLTQRLKAYTGQTTL